MLCCCVRRYREVSAGFSPDHPPAHPTDRSAASARPCPRTRCSGSSGWSRSASAKPVRYREYSGPYPPGPKGRAGSALVAVLLRGHFGSLTQGFPRRALPWMAFSTSTSCSSITAGWKPRGQVPTHTAREILRYSLRHGRSCRTLRVVPSCPDSLAALPSVPWAKRAP